MKRILNISLFFFLLISSYMAYAEVAEKEIIAEGLAEAGSLQSYDAALNRALRACIEQGVGVLIDSETMVQNSKLLDDRIYSEVKGYIKDYEVISDNKGEGGIYRVEVKATVALARLSDDIKALGLIRDRKENPRIIFVFNEYIDGLIQPRGLVQNRLENLFLKEDFKLIDKSQLELIKERDATLSFENPKKAAALGRRYGAELAVIGQGTSDLLESSNPYGVSVYAYKATLQAKAIKVDTADILTLAEAEATERGPGRIPTANKALESAALKLSDTLLNNIVEKWRSEVYNEMTVQLICSDASQNKIDLLKESLMRHENIKRIYDRGITENVAVLDVDILGDSKQLSIILDELTDVNIKVVNRTQNRIDLRFISQKK